ncbi:MAG: hypothetical protein EOO77_31710 [Oxalobacteraceae bacterium]|nr:MAG: hypothetical protein EOO77_31710 [Oxalobacteraceae bacterium]
MPVQSIDPEQSIWAAEVLALGPSGSSGHSKQMVRSELIDLLCHNDCRLTRPVAARLLDAFFDTIVEHLAEGGRVELRGFGSFFRPSRIVLARLDLDQPIQGASAIAGSRPRA